MFSTFQLILVLTMYLLPTEMLKSCSMSIVSAKSQEPLFPKFSKLPPEIRAQIWDYALPRPRIVHISNHATDATGKKKELYSPLLSMLEDPPLPSTCSEASQLFSRKYAELDRISKHEHKHPVFFDPKVDTLYLDVTPDVLYSPTLNRRNNAAREAEAVQVEEDDEGEENEHSEGDELTEEDEQSEEDDRSEEWDAKSTITTDTTETFSDMSDTMSDTTWDTASITNSDNTFDTALSTPELINFDFLASQKVLKSVRHLAIQYQPWQRFCFEHKITMIRDFFPCFPALETFDFVFGDPCMCNIGEEFRYPLEMEDITEGAYTWDYANTVKTNESRAFEETRRRDPSFVTPKWDVKALKKWKGRGTRKC